MEKNTNTRNQNTTSPQLQNVTTAERDAKTLAKRKDNVKENTKKRTTTRYHLRGVQPLKATSTNIPIAGKDRAHQDVPEEPKMPTGRGRHHVLMGAEDGNAMKTNQKVHGEVAATTVLKNLRWRKHTQEAG